MIRLIVRLGLVVAVVMAIAVIEAWATQVQIDEFAATETWTENEITGSIGNGAYIAQITATTDPYMYKDIADFAVTNDVLAIRYQGYSSGAGPTGFTIFYIDGADCAAYSGTCMQSFANVVGANQPWGVVELSMTDAEWATNGANITSLRIDFDGMTATGTAAIEYIRVRSQPDTVAPTIGASFTARLVESNKARLDWSAATDAADGSDSIYIRYDICKSTTAGACATTWTTTYSVGENVLAYTTAALAPGTHYFVVRAVDEMGNRDTNTAERSVSIAPVAPTNLAATGSGTAGTAAALSWTVSASSGVTEQRLYRSYVPAEDYVLVTTIADNTTATYTDTGLTPNVTYYYVIRAYTGLESSNSNEVSIAPVPANTPVGVSVVNGNTQATVSWTTVTNATSYSVYRCSATPCLPSAASRTLVGSPTGTSYTNTGLTGFTPYYYRVTATGSWGESADSAEVRAYPESASFIPATYDEAAIYHAMIGGPYTEYGSVTNWTNSDKPIAFVEGSSYYLIDHGGSTSVRITSDNSGLSFDSANSTEITVNGLNSSNATRAPMQLVKDGSTYYLIGVGRAAGDNYWKRFWVASSSTRSGPYTALNSGAGVLGVVAGTWKNSIVNGAWVVKVGSVWTMCYGGGDFRDEGTSGKNTFAIGCATSSDLVNWVDHAENPVILGRSQNSFEVYATELLSMVYVNGKFVMNYEHGNTLFTTSALSYFGFSTAVSSDSKNWRRVPEGIAVMPKIERNDAAFRTYIVQPSYLYDVTTGKPAVVAGEPDTVRIYYASGDTTTAEPYEGTFRNQNIQAAQRTITPNYKQFIVPAKDMVVSSGKGSVDFRGALEVGDVINMGVGEGGLTLPSRASIVGGGVLNYDQLKASPAYVSLPPNTGGGSYLLVTSTGTSKEVFLSGYTYGLESLDIRLRQTDSTNYVSLVWSGNAIAVNNVVAGADNNATSVAVPDAAEVHLFAELDGTSLKVYTLKPCSPAKYTHDWCVSAKASTTVQSATGATGDFYVFNMSSDAAATTGVTNLTFYRNDTTVYDWYEHRKVFDAGTKVVWDGVALDTTSSPGNEDTRYLLSFAGRNTQTESWSGEVSDIVALKAKYRYLRVTIRARKIPWHGDEEALAATSGRYYYTPGSGLLGYRVQYDAKGSATDTGGVL